MFDMKVCEATIGLHLTTDRSTTSVWRVLDENYPTGRKLSDRLKLKWGGNCLLSRRQW